MRTILTPTIGLYWLAFFAIGAVSAAGTEGGPALAAALATGNAVAAACFLWLVTAALLADGPAPAEIEEVAGSALVAGVAVTGASLAAGSAAMAEASAVLAALAASYVAIRMESRLAREDTREEDYSPMVARRLAAGAAHGSMLSRIAGRKTETVENEA